VVPYPNIRCPAGDACIAERGPRIEEVIEPETLVCACGSERHVIGEDVSERLDIIPAQFRVIVTRRPKYACRSCEAPSRACLHAREAGPFHASRLGRQGSL